MLTFVGGVVDAIIGLPIGIILERFKDKNW
jgi:hypothetical protein